MAENGGIILTSNWDTLGGTDLSSILIRSSSADTGINLDDMTANNCVRLMQKDGRENRKAHIEIKVNGFIKKIILLSEAQVIEVFGVNDEYLLTHNSSFFDDWEGMTVYYSEIYLPSVPVCKLKFTRIRNEDTLWIYGAKIHVQYKTNHMERPISFNFEQISRLLGNSNLTNIKSENSFKNLLQFYVKNLPNSDLGYLLGKNPSLNEICVDTIDSMHNGSSSENCVIEKLSSLHMSKPDSAECKKTSSKRITSNNLLEAYIDNKLNEIKSEILNEIDAKINNFRGETNHKLEKIICLLEAEKADAQNIK